MLFLVFAFTCSGQILPLTGSNLERLAPDLDDCSELGLTIENGSIERINHCIYEIVPPGYEYNMIVMRYSNGDTAIFESIRIDFSGHEAPDAIFNYPARDAIALSEVRLLSALTAPFSIEGLNFYLRIVGFDIVLERNGKIEDRSQNSGAKLGKASLKLLASATEGDKIVVENIGFHAPGMEHGGTLKPIILVVE